MKNQNNKEIFILNSNLMHWAPVSQQTQNMRNKTNLKIRELGNKYYNIKYIFDQLNIGRDNLFKLAREFEEQFKTKKQNVHIPASFIRMKELIICWFAEFFYEEISQPDSQIISQFLSMAKLHKTQSKNNKKNLSNIQPKRNKTGTKQKNLIKQSLSNYEKNETIYKINKNEENSKISHFKANEEIDNYIYSNQNTKLQDQAQNHSFFEDFDTLFN